MTRSLLWGILTACALTFGSAASYAATITPDNIPAAANCGSDCVVLWDTQFNTPYMSAVEVARIQSTGAFWLFGSGLMGLIGIAARRAA